MAIRKKRRTDKHTGKVVTSKTWYIFISDHNGQERSFAAGNDIENARSLELWAKKLIACRKSSFYTPEIESWINGLPYPIKDKFRKWDLLSGCRVAVTRPLKDHLHDWRSALKASGITAQQADTLYNRVERIFRESGFRLWKDISASKLMQQIECLQKTVRRKAGIAALGPAAEGTKAKFLKASKQFCKWAVKDGRALSNPLEHLSRSSEVIHKRRSLTLDEIEYLLGFTEQSDISYSVSGPERALLYRFAVETGFRANEISHLRRGNFDFDAQTVQLAGKYTKNGKNACIPLKAATADRIQTHLRGKLPTAPIFYVPKGNTARMIQKDLDNARTQWIAEAKDNPAEHQHRAGSDFLKRQTADGKVDFHALRHTFGSLLAASGVHPKIAQELMRHSDVNLTLNCYTHVQTEQFTAAINTLPELQFQTAVKTGTDGHTINYNDKHRPKKTPEKTPVQPTLDGFSCPQSAISDKRATEPKPLKASPKNRDFGIKNAVLTPKHDSRIIPPSMSPRSSTDRALASGDTYKSQVFFKYSNFKHLRDGRFRKYHSYCIFWL